MIDGTYEVQIDTPMGAQTATLILKTDGNSLGGATVSQLGRAEFSGGTVDGDNVSWTMKVDTPLGEMDLQYQGKVTGDDISGQVVLGSFGTNPFRGKRA